MIPHLRLHRAVACRGYTPTGIDGRRRRGTTTFRGVLSTRQRQCSYAIAGTARLDRDVWPATMLLRYRRRSRGFLCAVGDVGRGEGWISDRYVDGSGRAGHSLRRPMGLDRCHGRCGRWILERLGSYASRLTGIELCPSRYVPRSTAPGVARSPVISTLDVRRSGTKCGGRMVSMVECEASSIFVRWTGKGWVFGCMSSHSPAGL